MRQKIASITQMLRLPSVCVLCQHTHQQPYAVCDVCASLFKKIESCCSYCALPLPNEQFLVCGHCSKEKPSFDKVITSYRFDEPLRTLVHEFKYHEALYLRPFLVQLLLEAMPQFTRTPQCLVPVPLHPSRLRQRGFNQAAELAKLLAKKLNIPCELNLCQKLLNTPTQAHLNRQQRQKNLQRAFQSHSTDYTCITLIDDLLTTGSTANELARLFKQQGVTYVDIWCCARAI